jgi:alpha-tubulin suppressor-like RCC1 family protein
MRFIEIPALITEDIEDPSIVDITEPITVSISGTTMTIDGGSKVSGEATVNLTGDTTINAFTLQNIKHPSLHKISVKTNNKGNFTYVPTDTVTASSVSTTTKTGSDFEILLITTNGGETYADFDMADYTSPALYTSNALTGFDISELTSTYGATAKLYKPDGTLLTTVNSATTGGGVNFGYTESIPGEVTYTLEVEDDLGRKSKYDLPRKWISYAMETNSTPGFEKLALAGNEYTSTTIVPNISTSSKVRVHKKNNHGYLGINFKIQGRNTTNGSWVDIDDTGENENDDESKEYLAFGDYLYHRVWVKPTAKATATVSSSNVVTLSLTDFTEENLEKSFENFDPYDIDETSNTYVFEETSKVGTIPFTLAIGDQTYSNAFTVTTEEVGTVPNTDFSTSNAIFTYGTSGSNQSAMIFGSDDAKYLCVYNPSNGEEMFVYKGDPSTGSYALYGGTNGDGIYRHADYVADATPLEGSAMSWDGKYMLLKHYYWGDVTVYKNNETDSQYDKIINNLRSANYNVGSWGACQFIPNSYDFVMTMHANNNIYGFGVVYFENSGDTWTEKWTWENPTSGGLTRTTTDAKWGRFGFQFSRDKKYAALTSYANPTNVAVLSVDLENQTFQKIWEEGISVGYACAMSPDGKYVIAGNQKIFKNNDAGDWTSKTEVQSEFTNNTIFTDYCIFLGDKYVAGGNTSSKHLFEFYPKKEILLTYNDKDRITITKTGGLTTTTDKLYKDGVLYETLNSESMIFISETGVYQVISDDKYYSNKITVTTISETEARLYINHATTFLLKRDGKVWYWGEYHRGSNAMGNGTEVSLPTLNDNLNALPGGIKQIGNSGVDPHAMCAITNNGKLYTWGYNGHGQLGRNNTSDYTSQAPWLVDTQSSNTFTFCHCSYYSNFALQDNGYLWSCGYNGQYLLGTGNNSQQNRFYRINLPNVIDFHANHNLAVAVTSSNEVYIWGTEANSCMAGIGTTGTPTRLTALDGKNIVKVRTGGYSGHAISSDGKLYSWGKGQYHAIPDGTNSNIGTPTEMTWFSRKNIRLVDAQFPYDEAAACLALDDQGNMYVWGMSDHGAIGVYHHHPTTHSWPVLLKTNIASISVGRHSCGCIDKFGQVYTWGDGDRGVQNWIHGTNSNTDINYPTSNNLSTGTTLIYDGYDTLKLGKKLSVTSTMLYGSNTLSLDTKSDIFITDPHTYTFKVSDTSSGTLTYLSNVVSTVSRPTGRVYPPKSGIHKNLTTSGSANVDNTWTVDGALYGNGDYKASMNKNSNSSEHIYHAFSGVTGYGHMHTTNSTDVAIQLHMPQKIKLTKYAMYSRNFTGEYNYAPKTWKVYGSNDNGTNWTELDSQTDETVSSWGSQTDHRDTKREYTVTGNNKYFSSYKLDVTANGGGNFVVISQIEYYGDEDEDFITYDGFGKVTVETKGDTGATSNITYYSNTYEIGTARDLYITDTGDYTVDIYGSTKAFLGTHTVSADTIDNVPGFTLAFHHGTFADSGDPYSDGSVTTAATNGHVFSDTATGTYTWGTLAHVKERENPGFTANSTLHTDYSSKYGWSSNSGWEVSSKDEFDSSSYPTWKAFNKSDASNNNWLSGSAPSTSSPQWIKIKYPSQQVIKSYVIKTRDNASPRFPTAWKLQGANNDIGDTDTGWTDIGTEQTQTTTTRNTSKSFDVSSNTTAYQYYRLRITGSRESASSSNSDYVAIGQWFLNTANDENTTNHDQYTRYTYTPASTITAKVLMVAGGGGGAGVRGGGGAGGLLFHESVTLSNVAKSIVVGNGGLGGLGHNNGALETGSKGNNTSFTGLTTVIGGGGGNSNHNIVLEQTNGGSGGGGCTASNHATTGGGTGIAGPPRQGYDGGNTNSASGGAGGGGAGGAGGAGEGGSGGIGLDFTTTFGNIYGDSGYFASGGGGGKDSGTSGTSPNGGGGNGSTGSSAAQDAQKHTGGGGGGAGYNGNTNSRLGGDGGSGIVIIKKLGPINPPALTFDGYNKLTIDNVDLRGYVEGPTDNDKLPRASAAEREIAAGNWTPHYDYIYEAQSSPTGFYRFKICNQSASTPANPTSDTSNTHTNNRHSILYEISTGKWHDGSPNADPNYITTTSTYAAESVTTANPAQIWTWNGTTLNDSYVLSSLSWSQPPPDGSSKFTIKKDGVAFATTTSNTVYIRDTGTYTAEVKGLGAYAIELSNVVTGSISSPTLAQASITLTNASKNLPTLTNTYTLSGSSNEYTWRLGHANVNDNVYVCYATHPSNNNGGTGSSVYIRNVHTNETYTLSGTYTIYARGPYSFFAHLNGNDFIIMFLSGSTDDGIIVKRMTLSSTNSWTESSSTTHSIPNSSIYEQWHNQCKPQIRQRNGFTEIIKSYLYATNQHNLSYRTYRFDFVLIKYTHSTSSFSIENVTAKTGIYYNNEGTNARDVNSLFMVPDSNQYVMMYAYTNSGSKNDDANAYGRLAKFTYDYGDGTVSNYLEVGTTGSGRRAGNRKYRSLIPLYDSSGNINEVLLWNSAHTQNVTQKVILSSLSHSTVSYNSDLNVYSTGTTYDHLINVDNIGNYYFISYFTDDQKIGLAILDSKATQPTYEYYETSYTYGGSTDARKYSGHNSFIVLNSDGGSVDWYILMHWPERSYAIERYNIPLVQNIGVQYDNYNKITLNQLNYEDTAEVTYYSNTYNLGTAKTMYVKDTGEYVFKISGTDKYVESNVYVSSVDLAGAPTKPIDFDGYNKLTLIGAGSNVSANVTYFSNTYELGSAKEFYIRDVGTYDLEMSGSNVFALSNTVVNALSTPVVSGTHRFPLDSGTLTDLNDNSVSFDSGATFEAGTLRNDGKTSYKLTVGQNKNVTLPSALSNWCVSMWVFIPYVTSYGSSNSNDIPSDFSSYTHNFGYSWSYPWIWHMANGREFRHRTHHDSHIYEYSSASATSSESTNMYHSWGSSIGSGSKQNWHPGNSSNDIFMPEAWHHMAWEYNGTTGKFKWYCDGIERTTAEVTMSTGCSLNGMTFGDNTPNGSLSTDGGTSSGNPYWYISDLVIAPSWNIDTYNLTKGTYKHFLPIPNPVGVRQLRGEGNEESLSSPSLNFDTYNKLSIENFTTIDKEWPPASFTSPTFSTSTVTGVTTTNNGKDQTWTISGASYGNGEYSASYNNTVLNNANYHGPVRCFDKVNDGYAFHSSSIQTGIVTLNMPEKILLDSYELRHRPNANTSENHAPRDWKLEASNDGTTWVVLDTQANQSYSPDVQGDEASKRTYTVSGNTTQYSRYRLNITANDGGTHLVIGQWKLFEKNPRTAKLTDPNGDTYSLGQTQNDIYIEDTGEYILEVTNSDQSAVVAKTVSGGISQAPPSVGSTIELHTPQSGSTLIKSLTCKSSTSGASFQFSVNGVWATSAVIDSPIEQSTNSDHNFTLSELSIFNNNTNAWLTQTGMLSGGTNSKGSPVDREFVFEFENFIKLTTFTMWDGRSDWTYTQYEIWLGDDLNNLYKEATVSNSPTTQWDNNNNTNSSTYSPSSSISSYKYLVLKNFVVPNNNPNNNNGLAGLGIAEIYIYGYVTYQEIIPSLTYDTYNKLSIENITPISTSLRLGSNTYDIGTATDVYIEDAGTYKFATGDANTFALVSNVVGTGQISEPPVYSSATPTLVDPIDITDGIWSSLTYQWYQTHSTYYLYKLSGDPNDSDRFIKYDWVNLVWSDQDQSGTYSTFGTSATDTTATARSVTNPTHIYLIAGLQLHATMVNPYYQAPFYPPSLTYDTSNKLSIENLTPTSTTLTDPNGTSFDIGTATDVYIRDSGKYSITSNNANTFLLASTTVTGTPTGTYDKRVPLAFHHGTFADSDDPYGDGSVTVAATNGHVYSDTPTGTYSWGTLGSCVKTEMADNLHSTEEWAYRHNNGNTPTAGYTTYTWTPTSTITNTRTLVVAGGGGGGTDMGGGGGAGGLLASTSTNIAYAEQTIQVGDGGARGYGPDGNSTNQHRGGNGANSSISGPGITAIGGGGGATGHNDTYDRAAGSGGSGGGGSGGLASNSGYGAPNGTGIPGQGYDGANSGNAWYPGGGGGAGEKGYGRNGSGGGGNTVKGNGGNGLEDDILGTSYWWAGGGGCNVYHSNHTPDNRAGHGGKGGGGGGAPANSGHGVQHGYGDTNGLTNGQDGDTATANWHTHNGGNGGKHTGGGGGGGDHNQQSNPLLMRGGRGGSGIVVIQVPTTATTPSQSYDTVKTITVSNVPSTLTDVVGNIYKGSTAYPIHATTSSSNVIIKNTGTYLSVFTTATQAFFTNAIDVTTQPTTTSDDNTIEDEPLSSGLSVSATLVFHHDTFANSDDPHGDGSITTAAVNGHVYSDTPTGTYTWGTLGSATLNQPSGTDTNAGSGGHTPGNTTYTWTPPGAITGARMLLVGGGGGGGMDMGGGGGAGGFLAIDSKDIPESEQTVVVGQGGIGAPRASGTNVLGQTQPGSHTYSVPAYNGGDSSIAGETAYGGGRGGYTHNDDDRQHGWPGGSGGGASGYNQSSRNSPGGAGVTGQGNNGGGSNTSHYSGGGGGAGQAGTSANSEPKGGDGLPSDILGTEYWWSGGGGGGGYSINGGDGGKGGGGGGAIGSNPGGTGGLTDGQAGGGGGTNQQANTPGGHAGKHTGGGGGGGAHFQGNNYGGNGGSGIVIIKFLVQEVGYAGSTAVPDETTTITIGEEAPSETLDVSTTTIQEPTLNLDFTVATTKLARNVKRYNGLSNSSIGARFNRRESRKKRIEKRISIPTSFSAELTANNASSPTTLTVTVSNSRFYINGESKPTLAFIRGETYTFDQSDASNSGHPLVLATSEDGTQYTTGWTASGTPGTNGSHAFIVPYDVPDTIYYKCSNHNNMGGEIHTTFGNAFSLGDFDIAANTHVSGEYTLAVNYDGTTSNLYVNGDLISQTTPSPAISAGVKDFILGKEFDGYVKNFKFWNYAKLFLVTFSKVVFHYGSFDTVYGDADVTEAANNGHIFDDTPSGTYNWGTLGTPSTANRQTTYTWTPSGTLNVDILLVGGGGGSGYSYSGGGGAGGLVFSQNESVSGQQSIVVGDGANGSTERPYTTTGFDTSAFGYTAKGGGQGGGDDQAGVSGGSGGGGSDANVSGGSSNQDSYSGKGFGNNGGRSGGNGQGGGGGGGAGGSGDNAPSGVGGIGKDYSSVFGTTYGVSGWFAGGGAPSGDSRSGYGGPYAGGTGGQGGGGNYNQNGQPHTGGGGGGNRDGGNGYKGGSGIVIVILS